MPNIPKELTNTNISADVINALRNDASQNYRDYVPYLTGNTESLRGIGNIIMDNPALLNEFISTLVNRIAFTIIESKSYKNRLSFLKKGKIENGETIEDIFINIAKPYQYDGNAVGDKIFGKYKPDVRSAFYVMNAMSTYPVTVNRMLLKSAFTSFTSLDNFIESIIQSTYTAMEYDEQNIMLYMIAKQLYDGRLYTVNAPYPIDEESAKLNLIAVRSTASNFTMLTPKSKQFNIAGVMNYVRPEDLVVLLTPEARASIDVNALAGAFNIPYADFQNMTMTIPSLTDIDVDRLDLLFENDETYHKFTEIELMKLSAVTIIAMDRNFIQCYDNVLEMRDMPNPANLDWNYFLHHWATYAVSPFSCCAVIGKFDTTFYPQIDKNSVKLYFDNLGEVTTEQSTSISVSSKKHLGDTFKLIPHFDEGTNIGEARPRFRVLDGVTDVKIDGNNLTILNVTNSPTPVSIYMTYNNGDTIESKEFKFTLLA